MNVVFRNVYGTHTRTLVWNKLSRGLSSSGGRFCNECADVHQFVYKAERIHCLSLVYVFMINTRYGCFNVLVFCV